MYLVKAALVSVIFFSIQSCRNVRDRPKWKIVPKCHYTSLNMSHWVEILSEDVFFPLLFPLVRSNPTWFLEKPDRVDPNFGSGQVRLRPQGSWLKLWLLVNSTFKYYIKVTQPFSFFLNLCFETKTTKLGVGHFNRFLAIFLPTALITFIKLRFWQSFWWAKHFKILIGSKAMT